jgi:hypothetical protein
VNLAVGILEFGYEKVIDFFGQLSIDLDDIDSIARDRLVCRFFEPAAIISSTRCPEEHLPARAAEYYSGYAGMREV